MSMFDPTRDLRMPSLKGAELEGYVINVDDPEKRQRVKVRVPALHAGIPDDKLPWSNQRGMGQANAGGGVGTASVPDKYAKVAVKYLDDDPHNPQYGPSPTSDDVNKNNELLNEDYPNTVGHTDSHGNRWSTNKATGVVNMTHKSGATINIDGSGNISIGGPSNISIVCKGNMTLGSQGEMTIFSKSVVNVSGDSSIELNTSGSGSINVPAARQKPTIPDRSNQTTLGQ